MMLEDIDRLLAFLFVALHTLSAASRPPSLLFNLELQPSAFGEVCYRPLS